MIGQLILGCVLSALIGGLGYWRQSLTVSGVVGAILVGALIFGLGGWMWGLLLITFFVSSSWLSHHRQADKKVATEKFAKGSRRDLGQALANGGLGAILAVVYARYPEPLLFVAFVGAMSTVNADTWATEVGILSRVPPRLLTTGEPVPPGTSGGVTGLGMWASVSGALLIGAMTTALMQVQSLLRGQGWRSDVIGYPFLAIIGGLTGSLLDSLLGATVQGIYFCEPCNKETESPVHRCGQRAVLVRGQRWLNNDLVNFLASLVGALTSASVAWILG